MKAYRVYYRYEEEAPVFHVIVRGSSEVDAMQHVHKVLTSFNGRGIVYGASKISEKGN